MSRRERNKRRARHRPHPAKRILMMSAGLSLSAVVIGVLAAVGWVVAVADSAPNITDIAPRAPHPPSEIFAADGTPLGYVHADTLFNPLAGNHIPRLMKDATVAIEDRRFYQHGALDYQGILRAGVRDVFGGGTSLQGASTLTMQLVDNEYIPANLRRQRNLKYKIVQAKLAEQLESHHTKTWILDNYLNDAPYGTVGGETARGVGAASWMFFNKPINKLNLAQMALLAGLPQAPSEYNPFLAPKLALARRQQVIQAMYKARYITYAQAVAAQRQPLQVQVGNPYAAAPRYPFMFDYVVKQLEARYGVNEVHNGGLKVYTTIDPKYEQEAQSAVDSHEGGTGNPAAALSSVNPVNGHIVALAGTEQYGQTKFFYPVQALRQPGSSFKVFALMTLIRSYRGDPNQTYYNSHFLPAGWDPQQPAWSVHTAEQSYQGDISLTKATIVSDNTVFAQLVVDLGISKFEATARAMGIPGYLLNGNPAEVIGGLKQGVTTLQMADAYATLADRGSHVPPTILTKVVFPNGKVDHLGNPAHTQVFTDGQAYAATQVLKGVIAQGTGTAANYGCPAAGKTGTAENLANAWFVGYTPKLSTAVWVGYPGGNVPMANGFGGTLAAPIWHDFMQVASDGYCGDFPGPSHPFYGTQFTGGHTTGAPQSNAGSGSNGYGYRRSPGYGYGYSPGYGNSQGNGYGYGGSPGYGGNGYNNPTLYSQPPQSAGGVSGGGGGGTTGGGTSGGGTSGGGTTGGGTTGGTGGPGH
jgi:penicillin-binding protein 1A